MTQEDCIAAIYEETMLPNGFLWGTREGLVDHTKFKRLLEAVLQLAEFVREDKRLDKLISACLFESPWEVENTIEHYRSLDDELGKQLASMAQQLRAAIQQLFWSGLEDYYKRIAA